MALKSNIPELVKKHENSILQNWIKEQLSAFTLRPELMSETEIKNQSKEFLAAFQMAIQSEEFDDITGTSWNRVCTLLEGISRSRAIQGFSPSETATFILSLKQPIFILLQKEFEDDPKTLTSQLWLVTTLIDKLGLFTCEAFIRNKEEIIERQQEEMLELSTPVVKLWDQVVAVPLIGTLDSSRTQVVMESLLQEIVNTSSSVAIIDITGVPTVDTLVAQHLIKTVSAARLMGADCIISGIRPQIAQTMVHLGVSFADIIT
ncbi:MAG: STAS domain-containing protein, partial [Thermodesulfobacteriota bacterium]|nr:STAS domain-containing protein [Thermodesulfobacteriota bacterium]